MAKQPHDLLKNVEGKLKEQVDALEREIDYVLEKQYEGGTFQFMPKRGTRVSERVLEELRRRYHGWSIEPKSSYDSRDNDCESWLEFTPRTQSE